MDCEPSIPFPVYYILSGDSFLDSLERVTSLQYVPTNGGWTSIVSYPDHVIERNFQRISYERDSKLGGYLSIVSQ